MRDYFPGSAYVDLIGVTLYNRGRSRPDAWSVWKEPEFLLSEFDLLTKLQQFNKPIIIDELGTTAANFDGKWTHEKAISSIANDTSSKNTWLRKWKLVAARHPDIVGLLYFNVDHTQGGQHAVL